VEPTYLASAAAFRAWLEEHHASAPELLVGFHRVGSGQPSMVYQEALDQALCYGWIDGVRRRVDDQRWTIRFTPRRRGSYWSEVNTRRAEELIALGLMRPAGLAAFEARDPAATARYSNEARSQGLGADAEASLRADPSAWEFFQRQPAGYRRVTSWWVMSARRPETRQRRLAALIEHSARGERLPALVSPGRER
jgi:uncharacterized protein YdeI (YjbR/CyaY-like superfamily)